MTAYSLSATSLLSAPLHVPRREIPKHALLYFRLLEPLADPLRFLVFFSANMLAPVFI